jgi:hypothetical protein
VPAAHTSARVIINYLLILHDLDLEITLGYQLLQPHILGLELLQAPDLIRLKAELCGSKTCAPIKSHENRTEHTVGREHTVGDYGGVSCGGVLVRRGRSRHEGEQPYIRFCFPDTATADAFRDRFGGVRLTYAPEKPRPRTSSPTAA